MGSDYFQTGYQPVVNSGGNRLKMHFHQGITLISVIYFPEGTWGVKIYFSKYTVSAAKNELMTLIEAPGEVDQEVAKILYQKNRQYEFRCIV